MDTRRLDSNEMRTIGDDWPSIRSIDDILSAETARGRSNEPAVRRESTEEAIFAAGRMLMFAVIAAGLAMMAVMAAEVSGWLRDGMPQPGAPMIYLEDAE